MEQMWDSIEEAYDGDFALNSYESLKSEVDTSSQVDLEANKDLLHIQFPSARKHKSQCFANNEESTEKIRKDLATENSKLRDKEEHLKNLFERAKKESTKLRKAKEELQRCRESLKRREQSLQMEEIEVMHEKEQIEHEKEDLMKLKAQLSHDFAKLKQERQKLQVEKRDIECASKEIGKTSKKLTREKVLLKKSSLNLKPKVFETKEKLEDCNNQNLELNITSISTEPINMLSPQLFKTRSEPSTDRKVAKTPIPQGRVLTFNRD
ncbi:unnamed protein product [Blepharisma stoltei]|uniref:Uncharacterized protein n=1 Tax=Blepharisma stoltei TaxID=1481888 RepID=A0AAU9JQM1_9CILI|nr:unnamed protein product [Blepharisma stoltei]